MKNKKVRVTSVPKPQPEITGYYGLSPYPDRLAEKSISVNKSLKAVPRNEASIEAESGETVVMDSKNYNIYGNRHSQGGTPLALPDPNETPSFIFSRDKKLKIKNPAILEQFGYSSPAVPADISKKYDLNEYQKVLADKNSDRIQIETAEAMIAKYNDKLGKLALVQESMKGFPDGIPFIAMPYLMNMGMNPEDIAPEEPNLNLSQQPIAKYGGQYGNGGTYRVRVVGLPKAQDGKNLTGKAKKTYDELKTFFNDPANEDIVNDLYNQYGNILANPESYAKNKRNQLTPAEIKLLSQKDKKQIIDDLLRNQEHILTIQQSPELRRKENESVQEHEKRINQWDKNAARNETYKKTLSKIAPDLKALSDDEIGSFEATYHALQDLAKNPAYAKRLNKFNLLPTGKMDQERGNQAISPIDNWAGNTWVGQGMYVKDEIPGEESEVKRGLPPLQGDAKKASPIESGKLISPPAIPTNPKFWLQDVINTTGAVIDKARIKKYNPWASKPDVFLPGVTFYDPTRELAANAEQANIGTQGAAMFTGPQAFNSRFSQIQGKAAENAANVLSRYNNQNVGLANQHEGQVAGILNQYANNIARIDTDQYDKATIAAQAFDNSKAKAREQIRKHYVNAITNKEKTDVINQIYGKQFKVLPEYGGRLAFYKGKENTPEYNDPDKMQRDIADIMSINQGYGITYKDAFDVYKLMNGMPTSDEEEQLKAMQAQAAMYPGTNPYTTGHGW